MLDLRNPPISERALKTPLDPILAFSRYANYLASECSRTGNRVHPDDLDTLRKRLIDIPSNYLLNAFTAQERNLQSLLATLPAGQRDGEKAAFSRLDKTGGYHMRMVELGWADETSGPYTFREMANFQELMSQCAAGQFDASIETLTRLIQHNIGFVTDENTPAITPDVAAYLQRMLLTGNEEGDCSPESLAWLRRAVAHSRPDDADGLR